MFTLLKYGIPYVLIGMFIFPPPAKEAAAQSSMQSTLDEATAVLVWPERAYAALQSYL